MSFKQNILKKIKGNSLARKVARSLVPKGDVQHIDKESMRELLILAGYRVITVRDLELFTPETDGTATEYIVLDNGLASYHTTLEDVALRKSPTIKEMVNIRNVVKILKDDDVIISRKQDTVEYVREKSIAGLDLNFTVEDIDNIRLEGASSLDAGYMDGVIETLDIFSELLDYGPPPGEFRQRHMKISGSLSRQPDGSKMFGPIVLFDRVHGKLKLIDRQINSSDKDGLAYVHRVADSKEKAPFEGKDVFAFLMNAALRLNGQEVIESR